MAQTWTPKLKEATDALEMAFSQRNDTVKAIRPQHTSVVLFIDDVNRELDRLEGDLKKLFPTLGTKFALVRSAGVTQNRASSADILERIVPAK